MKLLEKIGSKDLEKEKLASHYGNLSQLAWPEQQYLKGKMWKSFFTIYEKFILEKTIFVLTIYLTYETGVSTVQKPRQVLTQSITIYDVAELAGAAFNKAFCMENIISAFKSTGIFPFNPNIFTDHMFLPAGVTDVPIAPNPTPNQEEAVMDPENTITEAHSLTFANEKALCTIMPQPKVSVKRFKQKSRQLKSSIITDKEAKLRRFPHIAEVSSETEDLSLSSDCDDDLISLSSSSEDAESVGITPLNVSVGNFVVAKVYSCANFSKNFIAKVVTGLDADNDYEVKFMKMSNKVKNGLIFPEIDDVASVSYNDIACVLSNPSPVAQTARLSNIFKFSDNLTKYNIAK